MKPTSIGKNIRRCWNREKVIAAIQERYQQDRGLNPQILESEDPSLLAAGRRYFGSWASALTEAEVPPVRRLPSSRHHRGHWTQERLLAEIHRHAQAGDPLYAHAMQKIDNCLISAATYHFGSWTQALTMAGFDPQTIRANRHYTRDSVVRHITQLLERNGEISLAQARSHHRGLYGAALKYFGSWQEAVSFATLSAVAHNRSYDPLEVLQQVGE